MQVELQLLEERQVPLRHLLPNHQEKCVDLLSQDMGVIWVSWKMIYQMVNLLIDNKWAHVNYMRTLNMYEASPSTLMRFLLQTLSAK